MDGIVRIRVGIVSMGLPPTMVSPQWAVRSKLCGVVIMPVGANSPPLKRTLSTSWMSSTTPVVRSATENARPSLPTAVMVPA